MNISELIDKKKNRFALTYAEIEFFVNGYVSGTISDEQATAMLKAICDKGMDKRETFALTDIMKNSGETAELTGINGVCVDKHSTGGVGDTTTLIVAPIIASLGLYFAKMSGRGLGFTGGTLDKLESIEGFNVNLSKEEFENTVNKVGLAVIGQTLSICPADKKLYALRDVTDTVNSIPLIAASIMCKKLAGGAEIIVLDVKCGDGAFMQNLSDAKRLAELMEEIGEQAGKKVKTVISDMNEPLSDYIGNSVEVYGALEVLSGKRCRLFDASVRLAAELVSLAKEIPYKDAEMLAVSTLDSGKAKAKFYEMLKAQGAKPLETQSLLSQSVDVFADASGYVSKIECRRLGELVGELGGHRHKKDDKIDSKVGIKIFKRIGDKVEIGEKLAEVFITDERQARLCDEIKSAFRISRDSVEKVPLFY